MSCIASSTPRGLRRWSSRRPSGPGRRAAERRRQSTGRERDDGDRSSGPTSLCAEIGGYHLARGGVSSPTGSQRSSFPAATSVSSETFPDGHRIVTRSAFVRSPRPKKSLFDPEERNE